MPESNREVNRRELLGVSALALSGLAAACAPGNEGVPALDETSPAQDLSDAWAATPESLFRNFVRVRADLNGGVSPWWWSGVYVAVTP
ncbi:MAG: hypothetical protein OXG59_06465, partial [Gammaproteobacteria bacterium]|nr:hypothetical protein [Gammaproteobacteria bacterium]